MLLRSLVLATAAALAISSPTLGADSLSERFEAKHVFELEYATDPRISPDGHTIVYARRSMDKRKDRSVGDLWTIDVRTGEHRPLVDGEGKAASPRWSPSGDRLLYLGTGDGRPTLRVLYVDTGQSFALAQLEQAPSAPVWSPGGKHIAFSMFVPAEAPSFATPPKPPEGAEWAEPFRVFDDLVIRFDGAGYRREGATHVFVVGADGGTPRQITRGDTSFDSPAWLDDDRLLVVGNDTEDAELDPIESELYVVDLATRTRRPLTERDGPDSHPGVSPDGRHIAFLGFDDELRAYQQSELYVMNADGSNVRGLTDDYDRSIGAINWRADGRAVIALVEIDGALALVSFPLSGEPEVLVTSVGGTSLGRPYAAGGFSVAAKAGGARPLIAYTAGASDRPAEVGFVRAGDRPRTLTALNEDLLPHIDLASIEEIKVASSHDGREIEAWVALPPGFEADGSYPMILEIHGGPFAMYGPFFAAEIQRYAAEGYVTVYANPRGSTGYGEEFAQLIDLAYPGNDYDDLMSVVDHLLAQNYVDPNRLFITGGSGGGVLTAWSVGKTDRFVAAATVKPVINWSTMALTGDIARIVSRHWIRALPWEERDLYWKLSPLSLVGNVTTPTLVMVGEEDWRTPTWESEQFYTALKLQKVDTALIRIPGASHSIAARPSRLIGKVDNILGWFERYDPAKQEPGDAEH